MCVCTTGTGTRRADPDHEIDEAEVMFMGEGFVAELLLEYEFFTYVYTVMNICQGVGARAM